MELIARMFIDGMGVSLTAGIGFWVMWIFVR